MQWQVALSDRFELAVCAQGVDGVIDLREPLGMFWLKFDHQRRLAELGALAELAGVQPVGFCH